MTQLRASIAIVLSVALPMACINLEDPTAGNPPRLVVQGVMDLRAAQQTILVFRARTGSDAWNSADDDEPVGDAEVSITTPEGVTVRSSFGNPGFYPFPKLDTTSLQLRPGGSYTLHVRTSQGEEAAGTTTIPLAPVDLVPQSQSFDRTIDTLHLSWPRVAGARSYEVFVRSRVSTYRVFTDTSIVMAGTTLTTGGDPVFPAGTRVRVIVSAVDQNYYDYYSTQSDPFAGPAPGHLAGAIGVFGSIASVMSLQLTVR
ncbi:MAG TPA: DUF4249 family protein [Gemmatimonadaceae bacterium]|nr:DUF4249 family protein [Gemmatimonadaceae bacterium]